MDELNQSLDQATSKFSKLDNLLKSMVRSMNSLSAGMSKASNSLSSVGFGGQTGLGGAQNQGVMQGSMGMFSTPQAVAGITAARVGLSAVGTAANMMPDVQATVGRASAFYVAGRMSGQNYQQLGLATSQAMQGGISQRGITGVVGAQFATAGIMGGSQLYNQGLAFTAGQFGSLGVDNLTAAKSFMNTYSGSGASALMRGSGIMLTDPMTGKQLGTRQLFQQLESRVVNNPNLTVEGINSAVRSGYLTSSLSGAGLQDEGMQQAFIQYLRDKAQGKSTAYLEGDTSAMGDNPLSAISKVEGAADLAMDKATPAYLSGIETAAGALVTLNQAAGDLAAQFGALKSSISYFTGDPTGGALTGGLGAAGGAVAQGAMAYGAAKAFGAGRNPASNTRSGPAARGPGKVTRAAGGRGGGLIGSVLAVPDLINGISTGNSTAIGGSIGSIAGGILGGVVGSAFGPAGTIVGGMLGSMAGDFIGSAIGGAIGGDSGATTTSSNTNQPTGKWLSHPVDRPNITAYFGQKYSSFDPSRLVWPDGHRGIDYEATESTTVKAAADGLAYSKSSGALGNYVLIDHQNGYYTFYCHLSSVNVSGHVKRGQSIGKAGNTGSSSGGVHLHFALSTSDSTANVIDPVPYLGGAPSSTGMTTGTSEGVDSTTGVATTAASAAGETYWSNPSTQVNIQGLAGAMSSSASSNGVGATGVNSTSSSGSPAAWYGPNSRGAGATAAPGAATGVDYVPQDGIYRLHQGESVLTAQETAARRDGMRGGGKAGNNITINVNVSDLSEEEAVRFSRRVKDILEKETISNAVGRK
jgi:hypothetical protein